MRPQYEDELVIFFFTLLENVFILLCLNFLRRHVGAKTRQCLVLKNRFLSSKYKLTIASTYKLHHFKWSLSA